MTGRAAIVREANLVEIEEIEIPGPVGPNEVLVQTECTFISTGTELANFTGLDPGVHVPGSWNHFPARPGYANCGCVIELGSEVEIPGAGRSRLHPAQARFPPSCGRGRPQHHRRARSR